MRTGLLKIQLLVILSACMCGCSQEPDVTESVDSGIAAKRWNTPDRQWSEAELRQLVEGERLYRKRCAGCHLATGEGQLTLGAPALRNSALVKGPAGELVKTVLLGRGSMPAFGASLQDAELSLILSYVRNAWGNQQGNLITLGDVASGRAAGN